MGRTCFEAILEGHPAYIQDTRHFRKLLSKWQHRKIFRLGKTVLEARPPYCKPSAECVLKIIMSSNNCIVRERYFTNIDAVTIGPPDSESITDIFGAIHIDKKATEQCPQNLGETTQLIYIYIYEGKLNFDMKTSENNITLDTRYGGQSTTKLNIQF